MSRAKTARWGPRLAGALRAPFALATVVVLPVASAAQPAAPPGNQGPMIVERVHSGLLAAPDFKVTEFDHTTSEVAGGYAGWLSDETFFVGGGGYWLANQARDRKLAYGGLVLQWIVHRDRRINFGAKTLVGGGQATLGETISTFPRLADVRGFPFDRLDRGDLSRVVQGALTPTRVRFREGFFVAEPEVNLGVRLAGHVRLTGGVGYRLISAEGRDENRLRGVAGSVALQIGGGS